MRDRVAELESKLAEAQDNKNDATARFILCEIERDQARKELAEAHAVLKEQEDLLFAIGPITCRNGIKHTRIDRCLYCEIERMRPVVVVAEDQARKCEAEVTVMHFTERGREFLTACLETVKAFRDYEAKYKP
jgi:hypothetical protein